MAESDKTFFELCKRPFQNVAVTDKGVKTSEFLEACEDVVKLFDILGSTAFAPVKSDMNGNIKKVRERQLSHPAQSETLEELVINEKPEKKRTATEGLMWLLRGLDFTAQGLKINHDNQSEELATSFTSSYNNTLKQYHNFVVKGIFSVAMKACPYRANFYPKVGGTQQQMADYLAALQSIVTRMQTFYKSGGYDKGF
ncbi:hypothetical protein EMMF5_005131 [Cystobasidiomycetes sp. EMM_F5]